MAAANGESPCHDSGANSNSNSPSSVSPTGSCSPCLTPPASPTVNGHTVGSHVRLSYSCGQRFKLLVEEDIQLCRLNHTRTIVSKIMNSKYLRRWESHHLVLGENDIYSSTVSRQCRVCSTILCKSENFII